MTESSFLPEIAYWCWIGDDTSNPPVLFQDSRETGSLNELNEKIKSASGTGQKGTATVLPDGRLMICGLSFDETDFNTISTYAKSEKRSELYHARLVKIDKAGNVSAVYEFPDQWPEPHHQIGTVERIVQTIESMSGSAWLWFGQNAETRICLLSPQTQDPKGWLLRAQIKSLAHQFVAEPTQCLGLLTLNKSGTFTLTTEADLKVWLPEFRIWHSANSEALASLNNLRVAQIANGDLRAFERLDGTPTDAREAPAQLQSLPEGLAEIMSAIPAGKSCGFVFSDAEGLVVSRSKSILKEKYGAMADDRIRGQVEHSEKGYFIFYLKSEGRGVLPRISEWWHRCSGALSLPQLIGSRLVQVGSDTDDIVYREKNDRLWTTQQEF
jgi:hypothetical protein